MAENDRYVDRDRLWRIYRDPVEGLCMAATVPWIAYHDIAIRLTADETTAFEAGNYAMLADLADRLRAWPERFADRIVRDETPGRVRFVSRTVPK
jgi:hypothetical protein